MFGRCDMGDWGACSVVLLSIFVDNDLDGFLLCLLSCLMYYPTLNALR